MGRQDEGCLQGYERRVEGLPVTESVLAEGGHREGKAWRHSSGQEGGNKCSSYCADDLCGLRVIDLFIRFNNLTLAEN